MIAYSLFEHCQPYQGMDPVEAARQSALYETRPQLMKLGGKSPSAHKYQLSLICLLCSRNGATRPGLTRSTTPVV